MNFFKSPTSFGEVYGHRYVRNSPSSELNIVSPRSGLELTSVQRRPPPSFSPLFSQALNGRESPYGLSGALNQQVGWVDDPNHVEKHVVSPEIIGFRSRILDSLANKLKGTCAKVKDVAVYLAQADDGLERMAKRVVVDDTPRADK